MNSTLFTLLFRTTDEEYLNRLNEIKEEITKTGTYNMTYDELVFGAKLAWRNASRCIGRIQWNKLEVLDYRHIKTTEEMFHALCKHVEYATNNGNLRYANSLKFTFNVYNWIPVIQENSTVEKLHNNLQGILLLVISHKTLYQSKKSYIYIFFRL